MTQTLSEAVDTLIVRQRVKLTRADTEQAEWQTLPSIWEQLESAVGYATGQGGAGAYSSRPTIATGIVSLIMDIATAASEGAMEHAGQGRGNVPANLRAIAANLADQPEADDQKTWWREQVQQWVRDARSELNLDPSRPRWARGARCPDCGADQATGVQDGETVRTPALAVIWHAPEGRQQDEDAWKVRAVECRACEAVWFRGIDLDRLVTEMLQANLNRETMAS